MSQPLTVTTMQSPVGMLQMAADDEALRDVRFVDDPHDVAEREAREHVDEEPGGALLRQACRQLNAYFAGQLEQFTVPAIGRGSDFRRRVWAELVKIPYGATVSYGELARRLGLPLGASRAVGLANGANPIAIIVPCHRVIGANGTLIGYAGGLERKRVLLDLESHRAPQPQLFDIASTAT
ncbi:MAG: methylated-DNA--[protein]-cysteine S-methyltransferase [Nocardioidaceae bacterium]